MLPRTVLLPRLLRAVPPSLAARPALRYYPIAVRPFSSSPRRRREQPPPPSSTPIGQLQDRRLQITFTCTAPTSAEEVKPCGHRSTHQFSRRSYEKGIVLIECPGCKNRHLIADNLSWFATTPSPAHPTGMPFPPPEKGYRNVEDLMREKGEQVRWMTHEDGDEHAKTWEAVAADDVPKA